MTTDFVISILQEGFDTPVNRYGSEYDFKTPAIFVQILSEKSYSFSKQTIVTVWITFQDATSLQSIEQHIDKVFHKGYLGPQESVYVYQVLKADEDFEDLGNGFFMKKLSYTLVYEEVQ